MMRRQGTTLAAAAVTLALGLLSLPAAGPATLADAAEPTVHFTAAGDYAAGVNAQAVLQKIAAIAPDLNLALGDFSYAATGAEQAWCDLVTQNLGAGFPFELISGNHESNGLNGNINDFSACLPNQLPGAVGTYGRKWYVDVPRQNPLVRFVMISPGLTFPQGTVGYTVGSPEYVWTSAAIDGARAASIPWVVVGMHKPCLSIGQYACDSGADLNNLLLTKKVDLVLSGHEHLYQRSKQLTLSAGCPRVVPGTFDADCVADSDESLVKGAGTVFATVGTGGIAQRPIFPTDPDAPYFAAASGLDTATWGALDVQATATALTASFARGSGGTFSDSFTIAPGGAPTNQPPTASFTSSCTQLACTVDASGSSDTDGTITGYAWDFGGGATTAGVTASHTYAASGSYPVVLTVTDDDGATGSTTRTLAPSSGGAAPFAADTFTRTTATGLGTAETGGAWRTTGAAANYAVSAGTARILLPAPGAGPDTSLPAASAASSDVTVAVTTDKPITGSGLYISVSGRRVTGTGEYRAKVQLRSNGSVALGLTRTAGSVETALQASAVVPGLLHTPGDRLLIRVQMVGSTPTTVQAKVWKAGTAEPGPWQASRTDSTAGLQGPGFVALNFYLSSSATNTPITVLVDDLAAQAP